MVQYFFGIPGVSDYNRFEEGSNPADWMLVISNEQAELHLNVDFSVEFAKSQMAADLHKKIDAVFE